MVPPESVALEDWLVMRLKVVAPPSTDLLGAGLAPPPLSPLEPPPPPSPGFGLVLPEGKVAGVVSCMLEGRRGRGRFGSTLFDVHIL